jgi:hypothetical protein
MANHSDKPHQVKLSSKLLAAKTLEYQRFFQGSTLVKTPAVTASRAQTQLLPIVSIMRRRCNSVSADTMTPTDVVGFCRIN